MPTKKCITSNKLNILTLKIIASISISISFLLNIYTHINNINTFWASNIESMIQLILVLHQSVIHWGLILLISKNLLFFCVSTSVWCMSAFAFSFFLSFFLSFCLSFFLPLPFLTFFFSFFLLYFFFCFSLLLILIQILLSFLSLSRSLTDFLCLFNTHIHTLYMFNVSNTDENALSLFFHTHTHILSLFLYYLIPSFNDTHTHTFSYLIPSFNVFKSDENATRIIFSWRSQSHGQKVTWRKVNSLKIR